MKLYTYNNGKFKFCGLTLFKFKYTDNKEKFKFLGLTLYKLENKENKFYFYLFNIPVCQYNKKLSWLIKVVNRDCDFDMYEKDEKVASVVSDISCSITKFNDKNIAYLATQLYDMGGHSKCIFNSVKSLDGIYNQHLFLTKKYRDELKIIPLLKQYLDVTYVADINWLKFKRNVKQLVNEICQFAPKALFVYIHPEDILGAAVIAVLKKETDIKIIFINHASHFPNMGMNFADMILDSTRSVKITNNRRHLYHNEIIKLQSLKKDETVYYSKEELAQLKEEIGLNKNYQITMSGGSAYKFFDRDTSSEYFEMIKRILRNEKNLYHIVISVLNVEQHAIVDTIFKDAEEEKERLIFLPYQENFDKYFQCADVFIDSFPVSGSLIQVDLMRNKVASVVKINTDNPEISFQDNQMPNYPYMFETVEDMEKGVYELLHDENKRAEIIAQNYEYWLKTYESDVMRDQYINMIEREKEHINLIPFYELSHKLQTKIIKWMNSSRTAKFFKLPCFAEAIYKNRVKNLQQQTPCELTFLIYDKKDIIGITYFHSIDFSKKCADLEIHIHNNLSDRSHIIRSVLGKSLHYAVHILKLSELYINVQENDTAAVNVYKELSFVPTGEKNGEFMRYKLTFWQTVSSWR